MNALKLTSICLCLVLPASVLQGQETPVSPLAAAIRSEPRLPAASAAASDPLSDGTKKALSTAVNTFGLKLLSRVASQPQYQHKNVFLSPLSVFAALAMTEKGSAGKTRDAIRQTLAVPADLSEATLHESTSALLKSLKSQKGGNLAIANALWSDAQLPLAAGFVQQCRALYGADATPLDFGQPSAADTINHWVSEKTQRKIPNIVDPQIVHGAKVILTNAVYFKGQWKIPFPKAETRDAPFLLADGTKKQVPMMHLSSIKDAYRKGEDFEAAALTYEDSSSITLYAVLPAPGKSPEEVLAKIRVENLRIPTGRTDLDLRLPRFTTDFDTGLKEALGQMGMAVAFGPDADFAPMSSRPLDIADVLHKTRLEVDEEGTVASAATAVVMGKTGMRPQTKALVFDRPFTILICDTKSGAILFAGVIYEP